MKHGIIIIKVLLLAVSYFVAGKLSLLLAIPPGFATPVWPAAGIALAAVLMRGYVLLPGVFLGSFITNLFIAYNSGSSLELVTPYIVGTGIACGAVLQTAFGVWLVRRVCNFPIEFNKLQDLSVLFIRGGLASCLVNAAIGPFVLWAASIIPGSVYLISAFTWWVGDVIGVVLFAPVLLIFTNRNISGVRKAIVIIPTIIFLITAIFTFINAKKAVQDKKQNAFESVTYNIASRLEKDIEVYLNILVANERFVNASKSVSSKEFELFTRGFIQQHPGIQSLSWNSKVIHEDRESHEQYVREQGFEDYVIKDRFGIGKIEPAGKRDVYFPITYLNPYKKNKAAHGFDTYSIDNIAGKLRRDVLNKARDEGRAITTGRISLVQAEKQYGLIIYHPVYSNALQDDSISARREHLLGYVAGVFIMPNMLANLTELAQQEQVHIVVRDLDVTEDRQVLFDSRTSDYKEPEHEIPTPAGALKSLVTLEVAGHQWELQFIQKAESVIVDQGWELWYLLIGSLLFSSAFGAFLIVLSSNTESVRKEIEEGIDYKVKILLWKASPALLLALLAAVIVMFFTIILWQNSKNQEYKAIKTVVEEESKIVEQGIVNHIKNSVIALRRMAKRWEVHQGTPKEEWVVDAQHYVYDFKALAAVEWVDETYHVRWVEPLENNEKAVGLDIAFNDERLKALEGARERNKITLTAPIDLVQGYRAFISYIPLYINETFNGFIVGIFNTEIFISNLLHDGFHNSFNIEIKDKEKVVFTSSDKALYGKDWEVTKTIHVFGRDWVTSIWPKEEYIKEYSSVLPQITLLTGILFSLLVGFAVYTAIISNHRNKLLIKSQERFKLVVEGARDGIWDWPDMEQDEEYWSPQWKKLLGYEDHEIQASASKFFSLLHPSDINIVKQAVDDHITRGKPFDIEYRLKTKSGAYCWFQAKAVVTTDSQTGKRRMTGSITDINVRKIAEEKLKIVSEKLGLILDNAGEGIYGLDLEGHTTFANKAAEKMLGYSIEEMVNQSQHNLIHHHYADGSVYPREDCNIYKAFKDGKVHTEDKEVFWKKDGEALPVEYSSKPIINEENEITGAVVVFRDITERKKAELEKEKLIRELKISNQELDSFAYIASHDLKAPLRVIDNTSKWLEEDLEAYLNDDMKENMALLRSRVNRMEKLLDDLLEYSRIGKTSDNRFQEKLGGKELLDDIELLLSASERFQIKVEEKLESITVNRMPLQQILLNLISNAMKHHDKDKGIIEVTVEEDEIHYIFTVKDDGPGIPKQYHKDIFKMFKTLKPRDEVEGSGMGLAMVYKNIELYGGTITLESEEGKGCAFSFTWPKEQQISLS